MTSGAVGMPIIVRAPALTVVAAAGGAGAGGAGGGSDAEVGIGIPIIVRVPFGFCAAAPAAGGSGGVGAIPTRVCLPAIGFAAACGLGAPVGGSIGKVIPSGWVSGRLAWVSGSGPPHAAQLRREGMFSVPQRVQAAMS